MNRLGWEVFSFFGEGGDGQYEFDFAYTDALTMAVTVLWFHLLANTSPGASAVASFMPKPWSSARLGSPHQHQPADARFGTPRPAGGVSGTR